MRIMTYNIQHGNVHLENHIDLARVCNVIKQYDPDIIGLNEVRGRGHTEGYFNQAEEMAHILGYHCYFGRSIYVGGTEPYGNAVLSKYPIIEASVIPIPDPVAEEPHRYFEPRSICRCVVEIPESKRRFAVYTSHFGLSSPEHEHAVSTAISLLKGEALPFAFLGDFNMTPNDPLMKPLYEAFVSTDGLLEGKLSIPSEKPLEKIDYIFFDSGITPTYADIPQVIASDHCPVYADFTF